VVRLNARNMVRRCCTDVEQVLNVDGARGGAECEAQAQERDDLAELAIARSARQCGSQRVSGFAASIASRIAI
jgi:hypothetical protein